MTDKEQIIIDGKKKDYKILFRCRHIDDISAYDMLSNGIKITPENVPISDFELMLIENTNSPFGFSSICKRNNKEDVWEYSGFGHSGACSVVTALLKQLTRKTQECEELKKYIKETLAPHAQMLQTENDKLKEKFKKFFGIDNQECWDLAFLSDENARYRKALEEIKEYTREQFCDNCEDIGSTEYNCHCEYCEYQEYFDIINKAKGEGE